MSRRRALALAARVAGAAIILAATTGKLPHLVVTQAAISTLLTLVVAPLWLLDRSEPAHEGKTKVSPLTVSPFLAVFLMAAGTVGIQLPPVVAAVSDGGLITALALIALLLGAIAFWSVLIAPARVSGIAACGYIVIGGLPISMPAMLLILSPRDLYAGFHAATPPVIGAMNDQLFSGFILFAAVKITIWTVASIAFFAAARESAAPDDDDGGLTIPKVPVVPARPALPQWVMGLASDAPTSDEPVPARLVEKETAGAR
jgi:cytochrome c oxidase assembly factor CtaG